MARLSIRDFLRDMALYLPAQVVPGLVGFVSIPIITRIFSPEEYGLYSLVIPVVMILGTLFDWLTLSINRFYSIYEKKGSLEAFYGNVVKLGFYTMFGLFVAFGGSLLVVSNFLSERLVYFLWVGAGVFLFSCPFNTLIYCLRMKRQVGLYSIFSSWKSLISFLCGLLLVLALHLNIDGLLWGAIISMGIAIPFLWAKTIESFKVLRYKLDIELAKEMVRFSLPLVVGNIGVWVMNLGGRYVLNLFMGSQDVGIYSAAYNISNNTIMLLVTLFSVASGPISYIIWERDGDERSKQFRAEIARFYLLFCLPAVGGMSALSVQLVRVLTGPEYFEGYRIIPLVLIGAFFIGLQQIFIPGFTFYKKTVFIPVATLSAAALNMALNFALIPYFGYMAAAVNILVSDMFLMFLMVVGSRRFFAWKFPFKSLIRGTISSGIMSAVVYYVGKTIAVSLWMNIGLCIVVGVVIYVMLLLALKEIRPDVVEAFVRHR